MDELFDKIIYRALKRKATDIHLALRDELTIRFRVFGELVKYETLDKEKGGKLINYIKYKSLINTNYKLLPQTGDFKIIVEGKEYNLRISYLPSTDFESIVIRILNNHDVLTIDQLTYQNDIKEYLYWLTKQTSGLFLISGSTGSGKSTTLYTLLREIVQQKSKNIITIEDPVEIHIDGCLQVELNDKLGITYHQTLRQILRHDPDVIMIGEIRDEETAMIAMTCALTGHLVLSTIHASNAYLSLKRLMNLGIQKIDIEDVVIGVMSQRIRYDIENKRVIVLSELLSKQQIIDYFKTGQIDYLTFSSQARKLIEKGIGEKVLKGDIYE